MVMASSICVTQSFPALRLWIDANHDGISQPAMFHTLAEMGVIAISLSYQRIERCDENGNIFLFRTTRSTRPRHSSLPRGL
jgi:hypothetical protein